MFTPGDALVWILESSALIGKFGFVIGFMGATFLGGFFIRLIVRIFFPVGAASVRQMTLGTPSPYKFAGRQQAQAKLSQRLDRRFE